MLLTVLLTIATMALAAELAGILRCVIYGVPFGHAFGMAISAQIVFPILLTVAFIAFRPPNTDVEPLGPSYSRSMDYLGFMFWLLILMTLLAGILGITRFFVSPHADHESGDESDIVEPGSLKAPASNPTTPARSPEEW